MNHLVKIISVIITLSLFAQKSVAINPSDFKVVTIKTSAICGACKSRIEKALKAEEGVEDALLNLNNKQVKIKYNITKTTPEKLREVISRIGYSADGIQPDKEAYNKLPACCKQPGLCAD